MQHAKGNKPVKQIDGAVEVTFHRQFQDDNLGPDVQSIVSLTSLLMVKILTVLVSTVSNSQVLADKKCE